MTSTRAGQTILITGGTSGIGAAAAVQLAGAGARVLLVGRDRTRGAAVADEIAGAGGQAEFLPTELLSLVEIGRLAEAVAARTDRLDALINNAGGVFNLRNNSAEGLEATFALNTVAPFALAVRLKPLLARSGGRIVNAVTGVPDGATLDVAALADPPNHSLWSSYVHAKLALLMVTAEQHARWAPDGVSAVAVHPGAVPTTRIGRTIQGTTWSLYRFVTRLTFTADRPATAAARYVRALGPDVPSGAWLKGDRLARLPIQARDASVRAALWAALEAIAR